MYEYKVRRSGSGAPMLAESGGSACDGKGAAVIICGQNGERLQPLFLPRMLHACGDHALFYINVGYHIVVARKTKSGVWTAAYQIRDFHGAAALCEEVTWVEQGKQSIPKDLHPAVKAAVEKANCYHCRCIHYAAQPRRPNK